MKFFIDTAFDLIGAISAALKFIFVYFFGGDTDLAAAGVIAMCLLLISACHDFLLCGKSIKQCLLMMLAPFGTMIVFLLIVTHIIGALYFVLGCAWLGLLAYGIFGKHKHAVVTFAVLPVLLMATALLLMVIPSFAFMAIPLERAGIRPDEGFAYKSRLAIEVPPSGEPCEAKVVRADYRWSASCRYMLGLASKEKLSIQEVRTEGKGAFRLKGNRLWFSTEDGVNPREGNRHYFLVYQRPWLKQVGSWLGFIDSVDGKAKAKRSLGLLVIGFFGWALWLFGRRLHLLFRLEWMWLGRQKGLLVIGALFLIGFGAHQWRFLHHDHRMQMVTSRDDDGYMMERLGRANQYKTMDPARVQNSAYGAIGYYPYAFLPFVMGHLERPISVEMTNLWVRGLKTLISLGMLASVWMLAQRHFGRGVAICATLLMATNQGFLSYSSFPFYPDVCMAMFSTLALCFLLDLVKGWNDRAFFLAVGFAAMSVSIKFLTFLLFPFLAVMGVFAAWRYHDGNLGGCLRFLMVRSVTGITLCIAIFFLCNPYLDYNMDWITPNYKMASAAYSVDTPNVVAGEAATLQNWLIGGYMMHIDKTEVVAAAIILLGLPCILLLVLKNRSSSLLGNTNEVLFKILWLIGFTVAFQGYLLRSVTLIGAIDSRLLLPVLPLFFIVASWIVLRLPGSFMGHGSAITAASGSLEQSIIT